MPKPWLDWRKYPEEKPPKTNQYLVTFNQTDYVVWEWFADEEYWEDTDDAITHWAAIPGPETDDA